MNAQAEETTQIAPSRCVDYKNSYPLQSEENSLLENFNLESEIEIEPNIFYSTVLPQFANTHNHNFSSTACSTYVVMLIKIEFLDIFSPPPNC